LIVIDASAALSLALLSQRTQASAAFAAIARPGLLIAPPIFPFEVRNALLKIERRQGLARVDVDAQLAAIDALVGRLGPPFDAAAFSRVTRLARAEALSFFDACYLALAMAEGAGLTSRDGPLLNAARRLGVPSHDLR
jgi:predicted nucleic acid-binding protein